VLTIPDAPAALQPFLTVLPLQLMSYAIALAKGNDVRPAPQPREVRHRRIVALHVAGSPGPSRGREPARGRVVLAIEWTTCGRAGPGGFVLKALAIVSALGFPHAGDAASDGVLRAAVGPAKTRPRLRLRGPATKSAPVVHPRRPTVISCGRDQGGLAGSAADLRVPAARRN
jgi:hypothetical protein